MRLNAINPKDNPIDEVLYCFGSAGDFDDSVGQSVGGGRDDSDDSRGDNFDERDKVARDAGVSRNTIVGSGPGGRNIVTSGDGSPVKSSREVEKAAEENDTTVEEINRRIDEAYKEYSFDPGFDEGDVEDSSVLDEIAAEFDIIDVEPEFQSVTDSELENELRDLRRKGDYSSVFDRPDLVPQEPDFVPDEVTEGVDAVVAETERSRAIDDLIVAFQNSIFADQLPSSGDPQQQVEDLLTSIGERATVERNLEPFSIERIQNITEDLLKNPANRETIQTSVGEIPVSDLVASTEPLTDQQKEQQERAAAAAAVAAQDLDLEASAKTQEQKSADALQDLERTTEKFKELGISSINYDSRFGARVTFKDAEAQKNYRESKAVNGDLAQRVEQAVREASQGRAAAADAPDPSPDPVDDLDPRLFDLDEQADFEDRLEDTYDYPEIFDDPALETSSRDEQLAQARLELGLPEDATVEDMQNALDARRARDGDVADIIVEVPDPPLDPDPVTRIVDEDTGLPVSARQAESPTFSDPDVPLYGDEDYLDLYGAEPGVSLVDARLKAQEDLDKGAEEQGDLLDIPFTFVDDVLNQLFKADALTKERLEGGDFAIYSTGPTQEIIGSVDKDTGAITPSSDNFFNTELNPYYEEYERQQELARPSPSENEDIPAEPVEIAPEVITPYDFDSIIRSIVDGTETETGTGAADGTESLPAVGQPAFDFMRDFGAFSLSPQPDDAPEGIYSPTYLAPISELTAEQRQELSGLLGTPLGAGLGLSSISFDQTPMETAEALIESLSRDQSS
tara:strand:+ start:13 stop:2400 length:2388 start_codon:yes stop_codon:yes gene_type:complete